MTGSRPEKTAATKTNLGDPHKIGAYGKSTRCRSFQHRDRQPVVRMRRRQAKGDRSG